MIIPVVQIHNGLLSSFRVRLQQPASTEADQLNLPLNLRSKSSEIGCVLGIDLDLQDTADVACSCLRL